MKDEIFILYNIDNIINQENIDNYISEYLNIINLLNFSSYLLKLKIDIIIILLYNFNLLIEIYNKIYLFIIQINQKIIEYEIFINKYIKIIIFILYISLISFFIIDLSFYSQQI